MKQKRIFLGRFAIAVLSVFVLFSGCVERTTPEEAQKVIGEVTPESVQFDDSQAKPSTQQNYYFVFDGSGSMNESCARDSKITWAKEAFRRFLSKVPEDVNLGLYVFDNDGAREVVPLGADNRDALSRAIKDVNPENNTPLSEAMIFAADQLVKQYKHQLGYGKYKIIPITDGEANGGVSIEEAARYIAKFGFISVNTIGLCMERDHSLRVYSYSYRAANDYQALEKALEETLAETDVFEPKFVEKK